MSDQQISPVPVEGKPCLDPLVGKPADLSKFLKSDSAWNSRGTQQLYRVLGELAAIPTDSKFAVIVMYPSTKREHVIIAPCVEIA